MRKIAISATLVLALLITSLGPAQAHVSVGTWTHKPSGANEDPVNMMFWDNATSINMYNDISIAGYTYWGGGGPDNTAYFKDHGRLDSQDTSRATFFLPTSHWHARTNQGKDRDRIFGIYSSGTTHWDHAVVLGKCGPIGHAARNYDGAKRHLRDLLANMGYSWYLVYVKGSRGQKVQCDGSIARGNGWQVRMFIKPS